MAKKVRIQDSKKKGEKAASTTISSSKTAKPLWDDDDDEKEQQLDNDQREQISINSKFAQEFERKKQRQELQELQKEKARLGDDAEDDDDDDDDSTTSSSEDEDGDVLITPAMDVQVLKTIQALKRKDDTIYDPNVRFFPSTDSEDDSESENDDDDDEPVTTKTTKKRFKDVIREQILEDVEKMDKEEMRRRGNNDSDEDEDEDEMNTASAHYNAADRLAYDEEQRQLRMAFLQSNNDSDDDDDQPNPKQKNRKADDEDWLVVKKRHPPSTQDEELYVKELVNLEQFVKTTSSATTQKKLAATGKAQQPYLVDPRGEVEDGEQFLLEFLKKKKWKDATALSSRHYAEDDGEDDNDNDDNVHGNQDDKDNDDSSLEQLEKTEAFESEYNFRFEQTDASGASLSLQSYARGNASNSTIAAGLLRRPDDARRERRLARLQRKAEERQAKEEQLRRLKNAKRQELQEKLNQIQSILGPSAAKAPAKESPVMDEATLMKLLEGDFDPDQFEQIMKETYGDDFYEQPDEEWKSDADVKKSFESGAVDEEDKEIAAAMLVAEDDDAEEGNYDCERSDEDDEAYNDGEEEEEGALLRASIQKGKREETEIEKKLKAKMLDELYKLDYEDIVAGIPTRFKYRQVEPNNYGLSTQEILLARDSLLQQVVSLKQMAPYREGDYTVNAKKRRRFRELLQQEIVEQPTDVDNIHAEDERTQKSSTDVETADSTKKKRRRQKKQKHSDDMNDMRKEFVVHPSDGATEKAGTSAIVEDENSTGEVEPTISKRRRRKKKSAGTSENEDHAAIASSETRKADAGSTISMKKADGHETQAYPSEQNKVPEKKTDNNSHSLSPPPSKKKKSKKKKLSVKGVSATRFASYGLALAMLVMLAGLDQAPGAYAWLSHPVTLLHKTEVGRCKRGLTVRLMEQDEPADMKLREIQAELKEKGISYSDCFDRESLSKRLLEARQGLIREPDKLQTAAATAAQEAPSSASSPSVDFDRDAVAKTLRSRTVKELREECAQRRIRWSTFIEKEELVQALLEARESALKFSASGAIVPGQVAELTDEQLTIELESTPSKQIGTPLMLDVYATWCGPCQMMAPQMVMAASELGHDVRVAKLDSDKHPLWPNRLKVGALPTVIVFDKQGRELERVEGALMKDALVQLARRHLPN